MKQKFYDTAVKQERAVLVGVITQGETDEQAKEYLEELLQTKGKTIALANLYLQSLYISVNMEIVLNKIYANTYTSSFPYLNFNAFKKIHD